MSGIGSKEFIIDAAKCYKDDHGLSATTFGKQVGIEPRRMQKLIQGTAKLRDDEASRISLLVLRIPYDTEANKTDNKKRLKDASDAVGVRGDAKALVQIFREAMGFETDTDATTYIVKDYFRIMLREAVK